MPTLRVGPNNTIQYVTSNGDVLSEVKFDPDTGSFRFVDGTDTPVPAEMGATSLPSLDVDGTGLTLEEDGGDLVYTDSNNNVVFRYNEATGTWEMDSLSTEALTIDQLGQYLLQTRDWITDGPIDRTADPINDAVTVTFEGSDYEVWIPDIPWHVAHEFYISIPDGDYSNIHIFIPPYTLSDAVGVDDQGAGEREGVSQSPWIRGNKSTPTNVKFASATLASTHGAISPITEGINIVGQAPFDDEPIGVVIIGCQDVSFRAISFEGSSAERGFLPYASGVTIRGGTDFGSADLGVGVETKHGAHVNIDDFEGGVTGTVTNAAIWNNDGSIVSHKGMNVNAGNRLVVETSEAITYNADRQQFHPIAEARALGSGSDQTITTAGTGGYQTAEFDTVDYSEYDDYDTVGYNFVAPVDGIYRVNCSVQWVAPADTTKILVRLAGSEEWDETIMERYGNIAENPNFGPDSRQFLQQGDTVRVDVRHDEGSDVSINMDNESYTYFEVERTG